MATERWVVTRWVLREQRRALVLWAGALTGVGAMYTLFWPVMGEAPEMEALVQGLPEAFLIGMGWDRIGTAAGYLESTVFALLGPVLLLVYAVSAGARLVAGEEEAGTLELEVTAPVSRRLVLLQRALALVVEVGILTTALAVVTVLLVVLLGMDVAVTNVLAASLGLGLFVLAMGMVALSAGAVSGRRGIGLAVGSTVAVGAYLADTMAPLAPGAAWLRTVSPFGWYLQGDPLTSGVDPLGYAGLVALSLLALVVAARRFDRRDLGV